MGKTASPEAVDLLTRTLTHEGGWRGDDRADRFQYKPGPAGGHSGRAQPGTTQIESALYLMAGNFAQPKPEYNVFTDAESFRDPMENWPTPIVFSGFEIGLEIPFPYSHRERFPLCRPSSDCRCLKVYVGKPVDHPDWDLTAVLETIRPDRGYFGFSEPGRVSLGEKNTIVFTRDPKGNCRYLVLKPDRVGAIRELIATLVSEPPGRSSEPR